MFFSRLKRSSHLLLNHFDATHINCNYSSTSALINFIDRTFSLKGRRKKKSNIMFNVIIEGNIGSGKTSLIEYFKRNHSKEIFTLLEPIEKWRNLRGDNLFDLMKKDPVKHALPFQQLIQLTMVQTHLKEPTTESGVPSQSIKMMERSLFSARHVFVENLYQMKIMNQIEYNVYDEWYNYLINDSMNHIPVDLVLYLKTDPNICLERIKMRDRKEETKISIDYLNQLNDLHDKWLSNESLRPATVLTIDGNGTKQEMENMFKAITPFVLNQRQITPAKCIVDVKDVLDTGTSDENVRNDNVSLKKMKTTETTVNVVN